MAFSAVPTGFKPKNKLRRQAAYLNIKKNREAEKRDVRHRRKREEDKDPSLREERHATHVPVTIDSKRVWDDEAVGDEEDALGWAVDVERLAKRRKLEQEQAEADGGEEGVLAKLKKLEEQENAGGSDDEEKDSDADSMLESDSELEDFESDSDSDAASRKKTVKRATSPTASVATTSATNLELSPEFLKTKFPYVLSSSIPQSTQALIYLLSRQLFDPPSEPKILITTSLHSTLHAHADVLTSLFPNSEYVRRTAGFKGHKYSVREIASFASNRGYTALVILMQAEHEKKPDGLDIIHLPNGPHFHFSVTNWVDGKKLARHANDTGMCSSHVGIWMWDGMLTDDSRPLPRTHPQRLQNAPRNPNRTPLERPLPARSRT